jgi:hypothetical protein
MALSQSAWQGLLWLLCRQAREVLWLAFAPGLHSGVPVAFEVLPASFHDLTPLHELAYSLPEGASLFGDKGYLSADDALTIFEQSGVRLVTPKRTNMAPNRWSDDYDLALYRKCIETVYSQCEAMGLQRLHARTNIGFDLKVWASLLALAFTNILN